MTNWKLYNDLSLILDGVYARLKRSEAWKKALLFVHLMELLWTPS